MNYPVGEEQIKADIIEFENEIGRRFDNGEIRAPIHLADGNEDALIQVFRKVQPNDYVCCSWRSHNECLLKGVPFDELRAAILEGRSIGLCFPEHKVISSAIVGGIVPIAMGLAWAAKRTGSPDKVWCFVGDMTAASGGFIENWLYSMYHDLPITWVIADNDKSVCTPTMETWGGKLFESPKDYYDNSAANKIIYYKYQSSRPHSGNGSRIQF